MKLTARARNTPVIQATPRAQSRSLRVGPGAEVTADFRLPRLASIEGTVIDEDRRPLKGQMVAVAARHYGLGGIGYTRLGGVTTNTDGRYRIDGLPAGEPLLVETNRVLTGDGGIGGRQQSRSASTRITRTRPRRRMRRRLRSRRTRPARGSRSGRCGRRRTA